MGRRLDPKPRTRARTRTSGLVLTLVDLVAVVLAGLLVLRSPEPVPLALAAVAVAVVCRAAGLHRPRLVLSVLDDLPVLLVAALLAGLVLGGLQGWGDLDHVVRFSGACFAATVLLRTAAHALTHVLRRSGVVSRPVLVVGTGSTGRRLAEGLLSRREHGLLPVGMVDSGARTTRDLPLPLVGDIDDLDEVMAELGVDDVVFAFTGRPDREVLAAVRRCVQAGRQVFVVPRFFELVGGREPRTEVVRDIGLVRLHRSNRSWPGRLATRAVDVVVSLLGLVVLAPVLAVIAVAVRLETGPGVVFHQTRVGEGGRTFTLLKFRTLRAPAFGTEATTWSIDNDSRRGPVGRFLRLTGLEELPRLVNVLRGELSLVGPPPERPPFEEQPATWGQGDGHPSGDDRPGGLRELVSAARPRA